MKQNPKYGQNWSVMQILVVFWRLVAYSVKSNQGRNN